MQACPSPAMTLTLTNDGVYLDGIEIRRCQRVDIVGINLFNAMEVVLHLQVRKIEANYETRGSDELSNETYKHSR